MLFFTQYFFIFLLVVLVASWSFGNPQIRQRVLLAASLVFYGFWSVPLISLLIFSCGIDFICGKKAAETRQKIWVYVSLVTNLGVLAYFKYVNFGIAAFNDAAMMIGLNISVVPVDIVLPLGISFFTFQSMSYTIDMYRQKYAPCTSFSQFALYVTFFPQLVAGPIVRANEFLGQLIKPRRLRLEYLNQGVSLFIIGIFKKVVIADHAGIFANALFGSPGEYTTFLALVGIFAFSFQIYFDFSAYTDMARGLAYMFGYRLPINFDRPYFALGVRDFWRRWHISLSRWLRDYLYISLGGSRKGPFRTVTNVMLTMLIGGLWHGASWNFVIWGGIHGALICIETQLIGQRLSEVSRRSARFAIGVLTFLLISFSWVFFRAEDFGAAISVFQAVLTPAEGEFFHQVGLFGPQYWLLGMGLPILFIAAAEALPKNRPLSAYPLSLSVTLLSSMAILAMLVGGGANEFIYFQF